MNWHAELPPDPYWPWLVGLGLVLALAVLVKCVRWERKDRGRFRR